MFNEVRSSIIHKNCIDVDFKNSIVIIIIYLAEKHNLKIPNIVKYSKDRENILKQINNDRMTAKKRKIISILNGGFSDKYHDDKNINKFLENIEEESKILHEYFYKIDKRIDDEKIYNYKAKSFSRILQDYENQLLMSLYDYFSLKKIKMMSLIFDGILLLPKQSINIKDIENYLYNKSKIPMKISIKPFECHYKKFGELQFQVTIIAHVINNVIEFFRMIVMYDFLIINTYFYTLISSVNNQKVIHHNHSKKFNNIIDYMCNNCNLKIKNNKELIVLFHNNEGYDNSYMIEIFSKIENVRINCLAENQERFKMLNFRIPNKQYNIKIIDSLSFLQSRLEDSSKDLDDDLKIVTKNHFQDIFEFVNNKLENFPYMYVNPHNLNEKFLPEKKYFDNILTLKNISDEEYDDKIIL